MQAVTVPMTSRDEHNNVTEYRVVPLIFNDDRFKTIMDRLGKELRIKFMKLYKRTPDAKARTPAIEMSSWLAVFAAEQLATWYAVLVEVGQDPKLAALNTFNIFGEVFEQQMKAMLGDAEETKDSASEGSADDSDVPEDAESASEEAGFSPNTGSDAESAGQEGEPVHTGDSVEVVGDAPSGVRGEAGERDTVDNDSAPKGN
jgi:hypothetical protein